jgi:activator of Hsp90 ATPase-like protein
MSDTSGPERGTRMSDAAVQAKTGKTWTEWFALLDAAGADKMSHQEIVAHLAGHTSIGGWWQQMVTVTYEQERGLRGKHERPDGYSISASKTVTVPISALYQAWTDELQRERWLGDLPLSIRKATPHRSLRITWADGKTQVEVNFYSKGAEKSQVAVQHSRLADAEEAQWMKVYWSERVERLKQVLEDR